MKYSYEKQVVTTETVDIHVPRFVEEVIEILLGWYAGPGVVKYKISAIKFIRAYFHEHHPGVPMGLKEAKDFIEAYEADKSRQLRNRGW